MGGTLAHRHPSVGNRRPTFEGAPGVQASDGRTPGVRAVRHSEEASMGCSRSMRHALTALLTAVAPATLLTAMPVFAGPTVLPTTPFRSLTLHNGGHVVLRHGSTHRVTILEGSTDHSSVKVVDGHRLVIDRCSERCPSRYRLTVEVVAPEVDEIKVEDGGIVATRRGFPPRENLRAAVADGGMIDMRSMVVNEVTAAVNGGGRILTTPRGALVAKVAQGGAITYWGSPRVSSSIDHGGVVARGRPADVGRHPDDLGILDSVTPPVPPVPRAKVRGSF